MNDKKHYFAPNHLNKELFLTVWWLEDPTTTICYIQVSENPQNPVWLKFGEAVEVLSRHIRDFETTILKDVLIALKNHEYVSPDFIKKHMIN